VIETVAWPGRSETVLVPANLWLRDGCSQRRVSLPYRGLWVLDVGNEPSRKHEERPAMKTLACKDMGIECDYVATKPTAQEVKDDLLAHAADAHSEMLASMSEKDKAEMMSQMDERMKDEA